MKPSYDLLFQIETPVSVGGTAKLNGELSDYRYLIILLNTKSESNNSSSRSLVPFFPVGNTFMPVWFNSTATSAICTYCRFTYYSDSHSIFFQNCGKEMYLWSIYGIK